MLGVDLGGEQNYLELTDLEYDQVRGLYDGPADALLEGSNSEDQTMNLVAGYGVDGEVSYEIRIWGQSGTDPVGAVRTMTPGVRDLNRLTGSVQRDSESWQRLEQNHLEDV